MQLNFSCKNRIFSRLSNVSIENETEESIFLSGNFITRVQSGRGPLREFVHPQKAHEIELPIEYKERISKLLDENPQEPVVFEL